MSDTLSQLLATEVGTVFVTIQDGRTAYVRGGRVERDVPLEAQEPLNFGRGVTGSMQAHFHLTDSGWSTRRAYPASLNRSDSYKDATPGMVEKVAQAVAVALGQTITADTLTEAQRSTNASEAAQRRTTAEALRAQAAQLDAQAEALEASTDARRVFVRQQMRSGATQDATAVRTASGKLLFVDEVAGGQYGARRYRGEPSAWEERD